ncbi:hypothetical protein ACTFIY_008256 [Dictyostelium cf. discoideum]
MQEIIKFLNEGIAKSDNVFILSSVNKSDSDLEEMVSEDLLKQCSKWSVEDFKKAVEEFITTTTLKSCQILSTINSVVIFMISKKLKINQLEEWVKSDNYILRALSTCLFIKYYMENKDDKKVIELYETLITLESSDQVKFFAIQALSSLDIIINWRFELFEILVNYLDLYKDLDSGDGHIAIKTIKFFLSRVGLVLGTQIEENDQEFIDQASSEKTPFDLLLKVSSIELMQKTKESLSGLVSLSLGIFNGQQLLTSEKKQELSSHLLKNLEYQLPMLADKKQRATYFMSICCYLTDSDQEQYYLKNIEKITNAGCESLEKNESTFLLRENKVVGLFIRDNVEKIIEYLNRFVLVNGGGGDDGVDEEEGEINSEFISVFHSILKNTDSKLFIEKFYSILVEYLNTWKEEHLTLEETQGLFEIYQSLPSVESKEQCIKLLSCHERAISNDVIYCLESGDLDDILTPMEFYLQLMTLAPKECQQHFMLSIQNHLSSYFVILFEDSKEEGQYGGLYNDYKDSDKETIDKLFDQFLLLKSQTCTTKDSKNLFFKEFVTVESKYCPLFRKYFDLN